MNISPESTLGAVRRPSGASETRLCPVLVVHDESRGLYETVVIAGPEMTLGRDPAASVLVNVGSVSRLHAVIQYRNHDAPDEPPRCRIIDNKSTNGTYVNDKLLDGPHKLRNGDRITIGDAVIGFFTRTASELESERALRSMATTDPLTGVYNRGFMEAQFAREFERARRYRRPLSLLMVDLDHFKAVNDTHGHLVGDAVLQAAAQLLVGAVRAHDVVARYGGEEFSVLLVETPLAGAINMAERIREAFGRVGLTRPPLDVRVTASLGVAQYDASTDLTPNDFLGRADRALYSAKHEGRNCVRAADAPLDSTRDNPRVVE